jgi:plastocyanin
MKGSRLMKKLKTSVVLLGAAVATALGVSVATASPRATTVHETMIIVGHTLGQKGSDGLSHDTTYGANFSVASGQRVSVTLYNYDEGPHTITNKALGLNVTIPGAKNEELGTPSKTVFSFTPKKAGTYRWYCSLPCDKGQGYWAMAVTKKGIGRDGYMAGYITVTA